MDKTTFNTIIRMIEKELFRNDFGELCEYWDITHDDYDKFIEFAKNGFSAQQKDEVK